MAATRYLFGALLGGFLIAGACRGDGGEPEPGSRARVIDPPPRPLTADEVASDEQRIDPQLQPSVDLVVEELSLKLSTEPDEIGVVEARYVTWPNSSLGCPQPGMNYMQVLTDGVLIVLRHGGASYHYHGSREGRPFHCERPGKPVIGESSEAAR